MSSLGLVDLFEDVLLRILYHCPALDVLALERTCGSFRTLLSQPYRALWLSLLQDLPAHQAPNIPSHISLGSLSSDELKDIVTKSVLGARNWESSSPRSVRKHVIGLGNKGGLLGSLQNVHNFRDVVRLTPGGDFTGILWSGGYFQLWNNAEKSCLWTYPALGDFPEVVPTAFDLCFDHPDRKSIILCISGVYIDESADRKFLHLYRFDIDSKRASRTAQTVFHSPEIVKNIVDMRTTQDFVAIIGDNGILFYDRPLKRLVSIKGQVVSQSIRLFGRNIFCLIHDERAQGPSKWVICGLDGNALVSKAPVLSSSAMSSPPIPISTVHKSSALILHYARDPFVAISLSICLPSWRDDYETLITLVGKTVSQAKEETFYTLSYGFLPERVALSGPNAQGGVIFVDQMRNPAVSVPFASPYSTESVVAMSKTGRCILASTNNMHGAKRYYAFSIDQMRKGNPRFGQISFGRDAVGPEVLYMDDESGAIVYPTKDQSRLVVEYFD